MPGSRAERDMADWKGTADVVVIGGGIHGASVAWQLAGGGCRDVVVLEADRLAQASTGLSVGGIRQQFSHPSNILLSRESIRVFEQFEERFGVDIELRQVGYLFLARTESVWRAFLADVERQQAHGVPVEALSSDEVAYRWPYIAATELAGGTFGPEDGYADPYKAAMGFVKAARRLGVRFEEGCEVTGIGVQRGRVANVTTSRGIVETSVVVVTAGAWAARVAEFAAVRLPVLPIRRQVFGTRPFDGIPGPVPMILDVEPAFYLRGEGPALLLGMSDPDEPPGFGTSVDDSFRLEVAAAAVRLVPALEHAEILRGWAGLYAVTPDNNPIIGKLPVPGLYGAVGFSGHGFQQAPAVGRVLAELILSGRTDLDLTPYSWMRFRDSAEAGETRVV